MTGIDSIHFRILEDIAKNLRGEIAFPTSFDAALNVRSALKKNDLTDDQIVKAISCEPLIVCKLLGLANSPSFNHQGKPIVDMPTCVAQLGRERVQSMGVTIASDQIMRAKKLASFDHFSQLAWNHSLETATMARVLARQYSRFNPEEAFVAGLIHDIGMFYLLYQASGHEEYVGNREAILELTIGWHEGIGESILHLLGIPEPTVAAVHDHDALRDIDKPSTLSDVVYFASLLAGGRFEWLSVVLTPHETEVVETARERFAEVMAEAHEELHEFRGVLAD